MMRQIVDAGIINPHRQYKFHNGRKWLFDFAWPGILGGSFFHSLALEVEGGTWLKKGGHTSGVGFEKDAEKYLAANTHGWLVLRVTRKMVLSGTAIKSLKQVILRQQHVDVDSEGQCHTIQSPSGRASTAASTWTKRQARKSTTKSVGKGKLKGSRRPTRPHRRRHRGPSRVRVIPAET